MSEVINADVFTKFLETATRANGHPVSERAGYFIALYMDAQVTERCARRLFEEATKTLEPEQREKLRAILEEQGEALYRRFLDSIGLEAIDLEIEVPPA